MHPHNAHQNNQSSQSQAKQLMSFQSYVRTLSNAVDENTAYKKYKDFMANLSQSKVGRFFDANKDREWFRLKYHPIESQQTAQKHYASLQKRLKFYNDLNDKKIFDSFSLTIDNKDRVQNIMDAVIVHIEDGPQELIDQLLSTEAHVDESLRAQYVTDRPTSIVIDDINIQTTMSELQEVCSKASENLSRMAQLDPYYVEGALLRRKVVAIFKNQSDIKDICWKLSRSKLNGIPLNVSINKCLSKRVIPVDALTNHMICLVNDIRNAIILILNFDELKGLSGKRKLLIEKIAQEYKESAVKMDVDGEVNDNNDISENNITASPAASDTSGKEDDEKPFDISAFDEEKEKEKKRLYEFKFNTDMSLHRQVNKVKKSTNPILDIAHYFLVEYVEDSQALHELTKVPSEVMGEPENNQLRFSESDASAEERYATLELIVKNLPFSRDECTRYLDKLIWYLRIVHSFDFYKKSVYRHEDELTLRMSVIHIRDELSKLSDELDSSAIKDFLTRDKMSMDELGAAQNQKHVTKDEERFNYKSYGKVITDELASYAQRIQKPKSNETEEVYKCKHCTRVFQKLSDIGRHFVSKHRWAIDAIELETDFFNTYLFDVNKISPVPPKELVEVPTNRFAKMTNLSQMGEDPDLLQETVEAYSKMESFVREPAPRVQTESDPRNENVVDYADISFDDAI